MQKYFGWIHRLFSTLYDNAALYWRIYRVLKYRTEVERLMAVNKDSHSSRPGKHDDALKQIDRSIRNFRKSMPVAFALAEFSLAPFSCLCRVRSYQRGDTIKASLRR
jgi:hypothetical protein